MKIVMIGQKGMPASWGGVERHVEELATRLVSHGHDVTVYARSWYTKNTGGKMVGGVAVRHLPSIRTKHLDTITHTFLASFHAILKGADIFHYHGVGPALLSWMPRVFRPKALVIATFHSIDRHHEKWGGIARTMLWIGEWAACRYAHKTIAVSHSLADYIDRHYGCRAIYIPNGATTPSSAPSADHLSAWGLRKKEYLLAVSRLIPHKGMLELVRAFRSLPSALRRGKKLVIAGAGHYTDAYVKRLHAEAANDPDILLVGEEEGLRLQTLFASAYAFVHPSRIEGLPIAVLEAMSYGLPLLLSDIAEHRELAMGNDSLFSLQKSDALCAALSRLLSEHPDTLKTRGQHGREKIRSFYTWDHIAEKTNALCYMLPPKTRISPFPSKSTSWTASPSTPGDPTV